MSGRINVVAVHPEDKQTWYIGVASGGVWKTTNAGTTFTPVFQNEGSYSIGTVVIDPKNPSTIWVGTGEANNQRSVGYGDGIYRSDDGGRTWRNLGLKDSAAHRPHRDRSARLEGRLRRGLRAAVVAPAAIAASTRPPTAAPTGRRSSTSASTPASATSIDGSEQSRRADRHRASAPASHLDADPRRARERHSQVHRRRRHLAAHPHRPARRRSRPHRAGLLAGAEGLDLREGRDRREHRRSMRRTIPAKAGSAAATCRRSRCITRTSIPIRRIADRVYVPTVQTQISDDGGRTFRQLGERNKHVDNHYVWIDPDNTNHLLEGCDGGLYESWDGGRLWRHFTNLSVTQFYNVDVDNASPIYNIYGGTQDNSTLGGPSRSKGPQGADQQRLVHRHRRRRLRRPHRSRAIRTSSTPNRSTAASCGSIAAPASASASGRSRIAASRRCASTGNRRSSSARTARRGSTSAPAGCSAATIAATRWKPISPDLTRQTDRNTLAGDGPHLVAGSDRAASIDRDVGQHLGAERIAQARRPAVCRHRRWADPVLV